MTRQPAPFEVDALVAFYLEHHLCDEIDGGVEETRDGSRLGDSGEARVWFACVTCDTRVVRLE